MSVSPKGNRSSCSPVSIPIDEIPAIVELCLPVISDAAVKMQTAVLSRDEQLQVRLALELVDKLTNTFIQYHAFGKTLEFRLSRKLEGQLDSFPGFQMKS
jgi:hypothetical protein